MAQNIAAWLDDKGVPLRVGEAPMPVPGSDDIVIKNHAVAINPLDWHMQDSGIFVKQWPAILGCDVAGEVYDVGHNVTRFKKGDRVIGHTINLATGNIQDAAFALYSAMPAAKAAHLPNFIPFTEGAVLPLALETAVVGLTLGNPEETMPNVIPGLQTPAPGLPPPSLNPTSLGKIIVIYGGSSSVGVVATQIAIAAGLRVIAITSKRNYDLSKASGATEMFDYNDLNVVDSIVKAVGQEDEFVGIFDAISIPETYAHDLEILSKLGGGHLICTHPPPRELPDNVKGGMIFGVHDVAQSTWQNFVTPALESRKLKCLPKPQVVGKGLGSIQKALELSKAGISGRKLVVDLS